MIGLAAVLAAIYAVRSIVLAALLRPAGPVTINARDIKVHLTPHGRRAKSAPCLGAGAATAQMLRRKPLRSSKRRGSVRPNG